MTDAAGALVWDRVALPFGATHSLTGTATNPQRFPGQVEDPETGFHYNYFRDYGPSIGRYVESDLIGLRGGPNTYAYVHGNPIRYFDPTGELSVPVSACLIPGVGWATYVGLVTFTAVSLGIYHYCQVNSAICSRAAQQCIDSIGILFSEGHSRPDGDPRKRKSGDRSIDDPPSLTGATPEEVEEAAEEAGYTERFDPPRNDPNGARLRKLGNSADQVRIQSGNPADPNPVKQGPYVRISQGGVVSEPIPLAGNLTLQ